MDEILRQLTFILRGMWHRRWIGLAAVWLVGVVATVAIMQIPSVYEASARVYVDTQSLLKPLMSGIAVQAQVDQQVFVLSRTLMSRPNMEKLVRMADLDLAARSKEDQDRLIDSLSKSLTIRSAGRDNLYTLAYRDGDPDKAKRVVQSLVSVFVESGLGTKRKDSEAAKKFIEEQIRNYEKKLEDAENRLKEFKLGHLALADSTGKDFYGRMHEVDAMLAQARLELKEAQNARDALKRQVAGEEPILLPEVSENVAATTAPSSELDGRIDTLRRQLDGLRLRFTDNHPDVIATTRILQTLEQQKKDELAARQAATAAATAAAGRPMPAASNVNANPVYQQLRIALAEAEARVASLTTRVAEFEARQRGLRESAKLTPQIEADFAQLNRDYAIHKKNYEQLVARRESAEISGDMESAGGLADFRVIDPPRVSPEPVSPNRLLLLSLALLGSLATGLVMSFIASQIWPVFFDARTLRDMTGLPLLGTVSMVVSDAVRRRERLALVGFIAAFGVFVAGYAAGLLLIVFRSSVSA